MDIEAGGAAITGGLIAGSIQKSEGREAEAHGDCADCGTPVHGNFCSNCGQHAHVHRTLLHLGEEILHGVMHFDGRFWRTLPLLIVNPGRLTREWIEGKRTRYVSPLAMFLFVMFVMFFALSFAPHRPAPIESPAQQIEAQKVALAAAREALAKASAEQTAEADAPAKTATASLGEGRIELGVETAATKGRQALEARVSELETNLAKLEQQAREGRSDGLQPGSWQAQVADLKFDAGDGHAAKDKATEAEHHGFFKTLQEKLKNPDLALYKLQQTMYKFSFLLIPLSIPFMALLFLWRRGVTLYDHGVTVLYSLTFMAMLLMFSVVVGSVIKGAGSWVTLLATLAVPIHMFAQIKGAYSLTLFSALWRVFFLLIFCVIILLLFMTAIVYLGLGH